MLTHENREPRFAERTVVVGAGGFIGGAILRRLEAKGATVSGVTRAQVDLLAADAGRTLAELLRPSDALVCVAAIAPVKDVGMLARNLRLIDALRVALDARPVEHVLNIGSDAIYGDTRDLIDESFDAAPTSLHGVMHLTREIVLGEVAGSTPFATLRPTLVYGAGDPHDGYGPNRFRRLALAGEEIVLFGEGEELRDHVWIEDVAELAVRILAHRSRGSLNAATGTVISFEQVARHVISHLPTPVSVRATARSGPMPHDGYRAFDPTATLKAFPDFEYTFPEQGFARVHAEVTGR